MPEFIAHEDDRLRRKQERLAPAIEAAMARKQFMRALRDDEIPEVRAYGRTVVDSQRPQGTGAGLHIPTETPLKS